MMSRKKTSKTTLWKILLLIPMISATIFGFSQPIYMTANETNKSTKISNDIHFTVFPNAQVINASIVPAANRLEEYLPLLKDKKVVLLVNQTSQVNNKNLVDVLLEKKINIVKIFAAEHGFRGNKDAGEHVGDEIDPSTKIPVISLYGANRKPTPEQLKDVDIFIYDIQDVGARFYTFISTMHYVMEACAENKVKFLVLDRPNPTGDQVDGPILKKEFQSFVGMHPIPIVHGLTVGELAQMINGEKWLANGVTCDLTVIKVKGYTHSMLYSLPVKPSPNLPNDISIRLYPSLCFFEATDLSIGRGTTFPFQVIGYPDSTLGNFTFTPVSIQGIANEPICQDKKCYGIDLREEPKYQKFTLKYVIDFYKKWKQTTPFFSKSKWMSKLSGTDELEKQIAAGLSETEIRKTWENELTAYKEMRKKYLLYEDFK
jgi:uncharacterized protein YbbC (DUF1343 family)